MSDLTHSARPRAHKAIGLKPRLDFLKILGMCFGFFGIQIGFALQTGHFSRVFETLGADPSALPILWIAGPVTGLIAQPIVGYLSDRTWGRFGRRRPYFFWGAVLTTLGLFVMPNSSALWMAAGMLWILDSSLNITMEPFRAFVGDMLPERQRTTGYAAQSFFIGAGGTLGSALPWMLDNWFGFSSEAALGSLPDNIKMMFYVGAVFLLIAVMITVFTTQEYPPEMLKAYEEAEADARGISQADMIPMPAPPTKEQLNVTGVVSLMGGLAFAATVLVLKWDQQLYVLGGGFAVFGILQLVANSLRGKGGEQGMLTEIMEDMFRLPRTMRGLAIVQFFSWFAMFSMWIYLNNGVITHHYGGPDPLSVEYQEAGNWIGLLNAVYFAVAALVAFLIPVLAGRTSRKIAHAVCLIVGAVGFSSFIFIADPKLLWISMIAVGIVWASILSLPYSILSNALPSNKMGVYMGIFNFFIVIPQLVAASLLALMVRTLFGGETIMALGLGSASFVVAALATVFVYDPSE